MGSVRTGFAVVTIAQLGVLLALSATVGLGALGWAVTMTYAVALTLLLVRGLAHTGVRGLGPANLVTLTRSTVVGGVLALAADSFIGTTSVPALTMLTVVALVLDGVDGWVARRTRTSSALGARFDMEVDAFLILVLSGYVAHASGRWWVLALGIARYAFVAVGLLLPWLRRSSPPRYWGKAVAVIVAVALTIAAADVLPRRPVTIGLAVALGLLAESFGRQVRWLWLHRLDVGTPDWTADTAAELDRAHRATATATTLVAGVLVWIALVAPNRLSLLTVGAFARIPLEVLVLAALALLLPPWGRRAVSALFGVVLGLLTILKVLDLGFYEVFNRPFYPVTDWAYLGPGVGVVDDSFGRAGAIATVVAAIVLVIVIVALMTWSALRLTGRVARHRGWSWRAVTGCAVVWALGAGFGVTFAPGAPMASMSATDLVAGEVSQIRAGLRDRETFARQLAVDRFRDTPDARLLTGLRGKDVLLVFVESYGRVAAEGSSFSPGVQSVLDQGSASLRTAGFASRSAFLTSPTYGAGSWLAHATLQSGAWADSQQRYNQLVTGQRTTLTDAFGRAGWRTVFAVPAITHDWADGSSFYHFDQLYDTRNLGYRGPRFSYATMPDQYTMGAFQRLELATPDRGPVMAEIDLVSSHSPWTPLPRLVDWSQIGDGSVFDGMPEEGDPPEVVWRDPDRVRAVYGQSIEYSLSTLISFVQTYGNDDLVVILLGDHQPHTIVSGEDAGHDVPITIIARDPAVVQRIAGWGWQDGMRPGDGAPVWRMDTFRDRFLTAYGPHPGGP